MNNTFHASKISALIVAVAAASTGSTALAQTNPPLAVSGNNGPHAYADPSVTQPAGEAVYKGGQAATIASGAHGSGPAPIVNGADPDAKPFTSGVTNGTAEVGKGGKGTGSAIQQGATVTPQGAVSGAKAIPRNEQQPIDRATTLATTPPKQGSPNQMAGQAVESGGTAVVIAGGGHGGGPAPVVSGAVPKGSDFTGSVTGGMTKVGKGAKGTGGAMSDGTTVSPNGAATAAQKAPAGLATQGQAATALTK